MRRPLKLIAEKVASKKAGKKTSAKMLKAMKQRYLRWKAKNKNVDWAKKTWTPAQVHGAKVTAKAADKAHTAEIVSDYVAKKAAVEERVHKDDAFAIWAKEKHHKKHHKGKHHAKKKESVKKASAGLKAAVKKEAKRAKKAIKKEKAKKKPKLSWMELLAAKAEKEKRDAWSKADAFATADPIKGGADPDAN